MTRLADLNPATMPGYGDPKTWGGRTPYGDPPDDEPTAFILEMTEDELTVLSSLLAGEEILPSQAIALMTLDAKVTDIYCSQMVHDFDPEERREP